MRGPERDGGRASRRLLSGPTRCVTRLLKAVEVEPDNAHPKTRSYERKHVWSIRTRLLSRAEPVTWPCSIAALHLTEWSSLGGFRAITLRARARVSPLAPRGSRATPTRCSQTLRETIARRR